MPTLHRRAGFTLIEMLVTIAVLAILLAVAAPAMQTFTASQRIKSTSFDLYSSLTFARSEAIKRRSSVTVTPVSSDWNNGWEVKSGTTVLRSQSALKGVNVTLAPTSLTYRLDGRLSSGGATLGLEATSQPDKAGRRCIVIDTSGMPTSRRLTGSATCA